MHSIEVGPGSRIRKWMAPCETIRSIRQTVIDLDGRIVLTAVNRLRWQCPLLPQSCLNPDSPPAAQKPPYRSWRMLPVHKVRAKIAVIRASAGPQIAQPLFAVCHIEVDARRFACEMPALRALL